MFLLRGKILTYVFVALYAISGSQALAMVLAAGAACAAPALASRQLSLPCLGDCGAGSFAAGCLGLVAGVAWVVTRNALYSWPLHDALGIALILLLFRTLRVSTLKVACILLPLCFAYDIFMVFVTPLIFGGESVMVDVATGGAGGEPLPMLLRVPRFGAPRGMQGYSMLGLG